MGGQQSSRRHKDDDDSFETHDLGKGGQKQQQRECGCFLLDGLIHNKLVKADSRHAIEDPMGSPMPDSPMLQQHRQQRYMDYHEQITEQQQIFSSKYDGLESEMEDSCSSMDKRIAAAGFIPPIGTGGVGGQQARQRFLAGAVPPPPPPGRQASSDGIVHEGPDSEQRFHEAYQLLEVIGVGSTSSVHRCALRRKVTAQSLQQPQQQEEQHRACKIIDCRLMEERFHGMMKQFQTEIEALQKLHHPNIIRLYDVYLTPEKIFLVMELMEGGELFDYVVQKGTLNEEEAAVIVRKVTSALVYMHDQGIVHRDMKPENLLLKRKPSATSKEPIEVKIIDFGLSKLLMPDSSELASTFLGTRGYLAPEILQRRDYNRAVDTWALGVIVFVLLCGCLPFDDDSQTVPSDELVRAKFVLRFPKWAKNLSPSAKDLLSHLLDVNPLTRWSAEQALNHPWVKGVTASRRNLLASPGRMRKHSPKPKPGGGAKMAAGTYTKNTRNGHNFLQQGQTPPTPPTNPMVRKTSI